jgi:hypothetical protein
MIEFLAGALVGGVTGLVVLALCMAAARGERDNG